MNALLQACLQGDQGAWEEFAAIMTPIIYAAVVRTCRRAGVAASDPLLEDATQDVFVRLIQNDYRLLRKYDPARSALNTWLSLLASCTCTDLLRRRGQAPAPLDEDRLQAPAAQAGNASQAEIPSDLLTPRQRLVLRLLFDEQLDVAQAATLLHVDTQTIRSTKHKALERLRTHFRQE